MTAGRPLVSIIILCHNDRQYVRACVASLRRYTTLPYEIIFVDNGSEDGVIHDLRRLHRNFPRPVRLIRNGQNRFFAGGNNQGMRAALGEYVVLLNADTLVTPGWLKAMVDIAQDNPRLGLLAPYTNHGVGFQVLWPPAYRSTAELPHWAGRWRRAHRGQIRLVPWLIGFCLLIPRRVIEDVGFLDEGFGPGGFEDYDYCLRVRLRGFEIGIAEEAYVHHFGGRGYLNMEYEKLREGNRRIYWEKWYEWSRHHLAQREREAGTLAAG